MIHMPPSKIRAFLFAVAFICANYFVITEAKIDIPITHYYFPGLADDPALDAWGRIERGGRISPVRGNRRVCSRRDIGRSSFESAKNTARKGGVAGRNINVRNCRRR